MVTACLLPGEAECARRGAHGVRQSRVANSGSVGRTAGRPEKTRTSRNEASSGGAVGLAVAGVPEAALHKFGAQCSLQMALYKSTHTHTQSPERQKWPARTVPEETANVLSCKSPKTCRIKREGQDFIQASFFSFLLAVLISGNGTGQVSTFVTSFHSEDGNCHTNSHPLNEERLSGITVDC